MPRQKKHSRRKTTQRLWRSIPEHNGQPATSPGDEFPPHAAHPPDHLSRRTFLKVMGASIALASMDGCKRKDSESIVPYVRQPAQVTPGNPLYFATAMTLGGYAQGIIATSREGRPVKLDGNPDHPATLGSSDVFMQASLLDLYDPDRLQTVKQGNSISDWDAFAGALEQTISQKSAGQFNIAILTETISSPTQVDQIQKLKQKYPKVRWYSHDPIARDNIRQGLRAATGMEILPRYDFSRAKVIVSLDCDFLQEEPGHLRYARDFIDGRRIRPGTTHVNRLYVLESTHTITGTMADHRWAMRASEILPAAIELAKSINGTKPAQDIAKDLLAAPGESLILAGAHQPPAVHQLVHAMNQSLGNIGKTVFYTVPVEADADGDLVELIAAITAGNLDCLIILGGNPSYATPADLQFDKHLQAFTGLTVHLCLTENETSLSCQWRLPQTHFLEEWGDARAFDGAASIIQPLIDPLYAGKSALELLALLNDNHLHSGQTIVREYWKPRLAGDFETAWSQSLEKGIISEPQPQFVPIVPPRSIAIIAPTPSAPTGFELTLRPDPNVRDGAFTNNAWLQELPRPLTKLTWDNAALISPTSAEKLAVKNGDLLQIKTGSAILEGPAWILPGQPDDSITLHLGYGRQSAGRVGTNVGFNAYALRTTQNPWIIPNVQVTKTTNTHDLVATHTHQSIDDRHLGGPDPLNAAVIDRPGPDDIDNRKLIRVATLQQFIEDPLFAKKMDDTKDVSLTLYPGYEQTFDQNFKWAMSIDTQSCIGCNACTIACQAENNIPVVGKEQVAAGREMHWLRVDTYFQGAPESPTAAFHQPIPCMQCENAPCELVCPVGATVHDNEGLNDMVYNRCVGTRYCSNNCPYKVRRFNFFQYADTKTESLKLMRNPEVTVRSRGIMEKCTYCIQRITSTRLQMEIEQVRAEADKTSDPKKSAETRQAMLDNLQTACQQACPTRAIVFGNINPALDPIHQYDPAHGSAVKKLKDLPLDYSLLEDLLTLPRTTYLARVQNPNPAIPGEAKDFLS